MPQRFRVSAIGRIRPGAAHDEIKTIVAAELRKKGWKTSDLQWLTIPADSGEQLYARFCTVIPADALDDAWNIGASRSFVDAGYGHVAWKITPVNPDDPDGGKTTGATPERLMHAWLQSDVPGSGPKRTSPPEPFGSRRFWEWFEAMDD